MMSKYRAANKYPVTPGNYALDVLDNGVEAFAVVAPLRTIAWVSASVDKVPPGQREVVKIKPEDRANAEAFAHVPEFLAFIEFIATHKRQPDGNVRAKSVPWTTLNPKALAYSYNCMIDAARKLLVVETLPTAVSPDAEVNALLHGPPTFFKHGPTSAPPPVNPYSMPKKKKKKAVKKFVGTSSKKTATKPKRYLGKQVALGPTPSRVPQDEKRAEGSSSREKAADEPTSSKEPICGVLGCNTCPKIRSEGPSSCDLDDHSWMDKAFPVK